MISHEVNHEVKLQKYLNGIFNDPDLIHLNDLMVQIRR